MMSRVAIITGAGSGVGQSIALKLAAAGWHASLLGRTEKTLRETIAKAGPAATRMTAHPCDVADRSAVRRVIGEIIARHGSIDVLVNAAGTNVPQRALEVLSDEDYHRMIDANMNGAYYCVQAVLPSMRQKGAGTIVN